VAKQFSNEEKAQARRLRAEGKKLTEIAKIMARSLGGVWIHVTDVEKHPVVLAPWSPRPDRLQADEREQIAIGIGRGESLSSIAEGLSRSPSTVTREVVANGGRQHYRAFDAHNRARRCAKRPKGSKLDHVPLATQVTAWLQELWSPKEISGRLTVKHPNDDEMHVSHETIYQALYVQGRGELRRELARCLRSGRTQRKHQGRIETRGHIKDMVMISERPAEVDDRAVPGHWEGDLVMGAGNRSAVGTLVERSTRYLLLLHLPNGKGAVEVEEAMRRAITTLPSELAKSVTWDQGTEMTNHAAFSIATGIPVYFCDPHSPWQRGSNENTNGLLRQYLPKGTDLSIQSAEDLERIQRSLNGRPRETLGFMTPSERLAELVALTG
jgi:IS30 family transposase